MLKKVLIVGVVFTDSLFPVFRCGDADETEDGPLHLG